MRGDPPLPLRSKTPEERFNELGTKLMSVSKTEVVALEKQWQSRKRRRRNKTKNSHANR